MFVVCRVFCCPFGGKVKAEKALNPPEWVTKFSFLSAIPDLKIRNKILSIKP